ncbi:sigma-70 family RNA polymerase sigma factor [Aeromicrobium sp.]|uniref:sigma-70 family RNA polymerase sigma factor n=1 Tax=Aeromicrobium sp. TaxID=1871063 RepID=UPI0030C08CEB
MSLTDAFEAERPRLLNVGYRLTGSVADAEDAVQEAWLRLDRTDGEIANLQAWLTTVVSRLCLDRLTSAAARRETYVGQWLPEPIVTPLEPSSSWVDPLEAVVRDEDNRFAALVVLDALPPDQRVSFVLHDAFGVPFDEIADVLAIEPANARQLASRARKTVADPPAPVLDDEHNDAVGRFLMAMATGDLDAVLATLHPDALVMGDANGTTSTAVNVIHGADKFARFFLGLLRRYGDDTLTSMRPVLVNGQLGVATPGWNGDSPRLSSPARVAAFTVRDGLVWATYDVANPDKLAGVRVPWWPTR